MCCSGWDSCPLRSCSVRCGDWSTRCARFTCCCAGRCGSIRRRGSAAADLGWRLACGRVAGGVHLAGVGRARPGDDAGHPGVVRRIRWRLTGRRSGVRIALVRPRRPVRGLLDVGRTAVLAWSALATAGWSPAARWRISTACPLALDSPLRWRCCSAPRCTTAHRHRRGGLAGRRSRASARRWPEPLACWPVSRSSMRRSPSRCGAPGWSPGFAAARTHSPIRWCRSPSAT